MSDAEPTPTYYGHEDRLQRLESGQGNLAVAVGEHGVQLGHLTTAVHDGFSNTSAALDRFTRHFDESLAPVTAKLEDHSKFIEAAREKMRARADRWGAVRKAFLAVLIAGAGVGVKELVVILFHALKA